MQNEDNRIYLDQNGYEEYLGEINTLQQKLVQLSSERLNITRNDLREDESFELEEIKMKEAEVENQLIKQIEGLSRIIIIDKKIDDELIDINDIVTVNMQFVDEEPEEMMFKLVASNNPDIKAELTEISINSPLGQSVYQKRVGEQTSYKVKENTIHIDILAKTKNLETQNTEPAAQKKLVQPK